MNTQFKESFTKDLRKIRDKDLLNRAKAVIETVEQVQSLSQIPNLERLEGWSKYYRVRLGDYRVGLAVGKHEVRAAALPRLLPLQRDWRG